jgi:hypothetical protein
MSHYVECTPGFKDRQALIEALVAVGFDRSQIEVHEEVVPLFGYQGDERAHARTSSFAVSMSGAPPMTSAGNDCRTERTAPGSASTMAGIASIRRYKIASSRSTPTTPSPASSAAWAVRCSAVNLKTARSRC